MTEAAPDHTDPKHNLDELFQLLVHGRAVLPDTKAKGEILSALQRGDLQVDFHIRGGARSVRRIREPTPEQSREFEALSKELHRRKASEKEMREAMGHAIAFLYEHAPREGITRRVDRESWGRVFSLTIEDGALNVLPNCSLDYPWDAYSFTIANWWLVDELWPPPRPSRPFLEPNLQASLGSTIKSPRPGTADFWIDELFPNEAWRPLRPKRIYHAIELEINKRNAELAQKAKSHNQRIMLLEHVSETAVRTAVKRRLER
jgi:hypothetical protein